MKYFPAILLPNVGFWVKSSMLEATTCPHMFTHLSHCVDTWVLTKVLSLLCYTERQPPCWSLSKEGVLKRTGKQIRMLETPSLWLFYKCVQNKSKCVFCLFKCVPPEATGQAGYNCMAKPASNSQNSGFFKLIFL